MNRPAAQSSKASTRIPKGNPRAEPPCLAAPFCRPRILPTGADGAAGQQQEHHLHDATDKTRSLNDCFRRSLTMGGQTILAAGVSALDTDAKAALLAW